MNNVEATSAVRSNDGIFKQTFDHSPDSILVIDPLSMKFVNANNIALEALGYSKSELLNLTVGDVDITFSNEVLTAVFNTIIQSKEQHATFPFTYRRKDNTTSEIEVYLTAINEGGQNFIVATSTETSVLKKAQNKLNFHSTLLNNISDAIVSTDQDFIVKSWNKYAEDIFGWSKEEVLGKPIRSFTRVFPTLTSEEVGQLLSENNSFKGEVSAHKKNGEVICIHMSIGILRDAQNCIEGYVSVIRDITEQKLLEKRVLEISQQEMAHELMMSEKNYRLLFHENPVPMWMADLTTRNFMEVNDAAVSLYGYSKEEFTEMNLKQLRHPDDYKYFDDVMQEFRGRDNTFKGIVRHINKSGNFLYVKITTNTLVYKDKKVWLIAGEDVTEEVITQQQLKESQQQLSLIFENTKDAIWLLNVGENGTYSFETCNAAYTRITGIVKENSTNKPMQDLLPADHYARIKILYDKTVATGQNQSAEITSTFKEKTITGDVNVTPIKNDAGKVVQLLGTANDITDRQIARKELIRKNIELSELASSLQSSEANLQAIFNSTSEAFLLADLDGNIKAFNNKAIEFIFLNTEHYIKAGENLYDFLDDARKSFYRVAISKVIEGEPIRYDYSYKRNDGNIHWFNFTINPVYVQSQVAGISISASDITKKRSAEELVLKSQANLTAIIENTDAMIYSIDKDFRYIIFNSAMERMMHNLYGIKLKPGHHVHDFLDRAEPKESKFWKETYERAFKGELVKFEIEFVTNGIHGYTSISIFPMWEHGEVVGLSCFVNDISKERSALEAQRQSESSYRQIVETAQEGIWVVDENYKTTFVNQKMCEILEYSPEEIIGKSSIFFKDGEDREQTLQNLLNGKQGVVEKYESTFVTKNGKQIWAYVSTNPMLDKDGNYKGALAMVTDITDKVKLQQELLEEQMNSQHEIMRAVVDAQERERAGIGAELHDNINQLLATARLYINICLTRKGDQKESLLKSQEYVSEAIEELRKLSHALVGPTQDKIMGLIPSVEDLIIDISNTKNIKINFEHKTFREERNEVGLKLVIYRIIQEQINNILKHANATEIEIELKKKGKDLVVNINDNGKGFDTSIPRKGIGLKNIVNRAKLYNGVLQIDSHPGEGCRMKIIFKNHGIGADLPQL